MGSYHQFYKQLEGLAHQTFPRLKSSEPVAWEYLISPLEIRLPRSILTAAKKAVAAFFSLSRRPEYQSLLGARPAFMGPNDSVLMAYDFHTSVDGGLHLVEINTNASGYLLTALMQATHVGGTVDFGGLRESFERELQLTGQTAPRRTAIVDDDLAQQKMLPEFLMYQDMFESFGWPCDLVEARELSADYDLVYNRTTDFYLEQPEHEALRVALKAKCVTPQPKEYWLLADKERLVQLSRPDFVSRCGASAEELAAIQTVLLPTREIKDFSSIDEIWDQRRSLFFKPKRSYGGKSVYRGESVSRKVFERLLQDDVLVQKFQPAQRFPTEDAQSPLNNWKFDVRFFVYQDRIHQSVARAYQGQVTNFASPLGGFTRIIWT